LESIYDEDKDYPKYLKPAISNYPSHPSQFRPKIYNSLNTNYLKATLILKYPITWANPNIWKKAKKGMPHDLPIKL
jgi:hypothetical protein